MSLGVVVKGPEGVVLAADTRITLSAQRQGSPLLHVNFDNATKLLNFGSPHHWVGAVTYGDALIGTRTAHSFIPELEPTLGSERKSVLGYAKHLSEFFKRRWEEVGLPRDVPPGGGMTFVVGGYDGEKPYGDVFLFRVPQDPEPVQQNLDNFGMTWGGQLEMASRIIHGYDPRLLHFLGDHLKLPESKIGELESVIKPQFEYTIPYEVLPLQDCINLAIFLIRTTITAQNLAIGVRGVGGAIEVATITRTEGLQWIQRKEIHGENCS